MELADTLTGYLFCVFSAPEGAKDLRPATAVYLRLRAEARFLEKLLAHLYESDGVGISTSDDEVIPPSALPALEAAIRSAIRELEAQPETWPVLLGHRFEPFQQELVLVEVERAERCGDYLYWDGGE